jgi:acetyl esterase/lipase
VFLAVSIVGALLVVNVYVPARREPLTVFSFALGWVMGEVPLQTGVVWVVLTVLFLVVGALRAWPGWVGLAIAVGSWVGLIGLAVIAHRSKAVVDVALDTATGGAIGADGMDPTPAWASWWRLLVAVPFRFRSIRRIRSIDYWGDGNYRHKLDILTPYGEAAEGAPVMVYIHGGAWIIGDKREQGIPLMHELVSRGWVCVSINYRLSPRASWPAHIVDCKRAVAWVRAHIAEYGGDPSFIAVSGGSAGGHLCSLLALTPNEPEWQPGFEDADTSVDACVPFYGVYDVTGDPAASGAYGPGLADLLQRRVMKTTTSDNRAIFERASPDRRITAAAPPMFVLAGTNDTLVPLVVARRFVERLRAASEAPVAYVELPRAQHAFEILVTIRSRHTTMGVVRFLEAMRSRVPR